MSVMHLKMYERIILNRMNFKSSEMILHFDRYILVLTNVSYNLSFRQHRFEKLNANFKVELKETSCQT